MASCIAVLASPTSAIQRWSNGKRQLNDGGLNPTALSEERTTQTGTKKEGT
jgi:hypothetical protein